MWNHLHPLHPASSWMGNTIPTRECGHITFGNTFGLDTLAMGALHASRPRPPSLFDWVTKALCESALCAPTLGGYRPQCVDTELSKSKR
eukprot:4213906-Karenia_brevis.AAC.1